MELLRRVRRARVSLRASSFNGSCPDVSSSGKEPSKEKRSSKPR